MKRQMILFMRPDTAIFGGHKDSFSTDRDPRVTWEVGELGIRLSRDVEMDGVMVTQREMIPWSNVAKHQVIESLEPKVQETKGGPPATKR